MRGLVLFLLGGAVLFLAWSGYGRNPESPAPEVSERPSRGRMMSVSEMEAALQEVARGDGALPPQGQGERAISSANRALGYENGKNEAPGADLTSEAGPLALDWNLGDPVLEGSMLLHDPERMEEYLGDGAGKDLSKGRKRLLFVLATLVRTSPEQAASYARGLEEAADVTDAERDFVFGVLESGRARPRAASSGAPGALILGARMALLAREAEAHLRASRHADAARLFSALLLSEIDAPWAEDRGILRRWTAGLSQAQAGHRWNRRGEWPSFEVTVVSGDSLVAIRKRIVAERPHMTLCTGLIQRCNQAGKILHPGDVLRIPTDQAHALVDLSARWAFYLMGEEVVAAWEVAIGLEGRTIPGSYTVGEKLEDPPWTPIGRPFVPFGHPDNPLGARWIAWKGSDGLGFHGTSEPETIGLEASQGCIRLLNRDVTELFEILPRGAAIEVRP
ncbi:MAG TPA: L,D-transpeptidase [Planctomycetota bacterium]|nr:L,D-transpeptidase [Planctomycetota bacterium]